MASAKQIRAAANARAAIGNQAALVRGSAAAKARMAALRAMRSTAPRKNLKSVRSAKVAFTKYYNKKSYKRPSARKAAITRDLCSGNKPVITDRRYLFAPHRYDYPGFDDGTACPAGRTVRRGKSPAAVARGQALAARRWAGRGGARGVRSPASHCSWNATSQRCNKATSGGVHANCRLNKKSNCVKSPSAPKNAAAVARGRALGAARRGARKAGPPAPPAMPASPVAATGRVSGQTLQAALDAAACKSQTSQAACAAAVNCSWTKARTVKGKAVPASCGKHKGKYSLAAAQARR